MKFKLTIPKDPKHSEPVNCIGWTTSDELFSFGDDHLILRSNLVNNEVQKVSEVSNELFPTDMHWFPKSTVAGGKKSGLFSHLYFLYNIVSSISTKKKSSSFFF